MCLTMKYIPWPAWVNKISVLMLYFSFPFNVAGFRNENT